MIWLARHGETTWNVAGRYQGRMESPLSTLGELQGEALAAFFKLRADEGAAVPERIVASPLGRCTQTARFVANVLGLEVQTDERLLEIAHGAWEGRLRDELKRDDPARYRAWRKDPAHVSFEGGETLADVLARWRSFARGVTHDANMLVVTHDAVVRCALIDLQGLEFDDFWRMRVENAAFAEIAVTGAGLRLERECVADHLRGLRADVSEQAL